MVKEMPLRLVAFLFVVTLGHISNAYNAKKENFRAFETTKRVIFIINCHFLAIFSINTVRASKN